MSLTATRFGVTLAPQVTNRKDIAMKFTANVGIADRVARIILGVVLIGLTLSGTIGAWGWIGIVPVVTAFLKFCPAYAIFGLRTCEEC